MLQIASTAAKFQETLLTIAPSGHNAPRQPPADLLARESATPRTIYQERVRDSDLINKGWRMSSDIIVGSPVKLREKASTGERVSPDEATSTTADEEEFVPIDYQRRYRLARATAAKKAGDEQELPRIDRSPRDIDA